MESECPPWAFHGATPAKGGRVSLDESGASALGDGWWMLLTAAGDLVRLGPGLEAWSAATGSSPAGQIGRWSAGGGQGPLELGDRTFQTIRLSIEPDRDLVVLVAHPLDAHLFREAEHIRDMQYDLRTHLAHRLLSPLAMLSRPELLSAGAQERLSTQLRHSIQATIDLASRVLDPAQAARRRPGCIELGALARSIGDQYLPRGSGQEPPRIAPRDAAPRWVRGPRAVIRLIVEVLLDLAMAHGGDGLLEIGADAGSPLVLVRANARRPDAPAPIGDLRMLEVVQHLARHVQLQVDLQFGAHGQLLYTLRALPPGTPPLPPQVGLICDNDDTAALLRAQAQALGMQVVAEGVPRAAGVPLDLMLVDRDSIGGPVWQALTSGRPPWHPPLLVLIGSQAAVDGSYVVARKPLTGARLRDLVEFLTES